MQSACQGAKTTTLSPRRARWRMLWVRRVTTPLTPGTNVSVKIATDRAGGLVAPAMLGTVVEHDSISPGKSRRCLLSPLRLPHQATDKSRHRVRLRDG